jgi:hypothetical protein
MLSIHLHLSLPGGLFPSGFPTSNLYTLTQRNNKDKYITSFYKLVSEQFHSMINLVCVCVRVCVCARAHLYKSIASCLFNKLEHADNWLYPILLAASVSETV